MKENKITCFVCGAKLTEETEYSFDGKHMCQHCYDEQTVTCDHCGERIWCENQRVMMRILFVLIAMKTVTQTVKIAEDLFITTMHTTRMEKTTLTAIIALKNLTTAQ